MVEDHAPQLGISIPRPHQRLLALAHASASAKKPMPPVCHQLYAWFDQLCGVEDSCVYPGNRAMMDLTGVSKSTLIRGNAELEENKLVAFEKRPDGREVVNLLPLPELPVDLLTAYAGTMKVVGVKPVEGPVPPSVLPARTSKRETVARAEHEGAKVERRLKSEGLTLEEKTLMQSFPMMERYLLWGRAGLVEMDDSKLKPETMNWRAVTTNTTQDKELRVKDWKPAHFVGYYWFLVSKYNHEHNIPITLPERGWGRLFRDMATIQKSLTNSKLASRIYKLYLFMDLIKAECSWMTIPLTFNEATLSDNNVIRAITAIEQTGDIELTGRWEKAGYACVVLNGVPMTPEAAKQNGESNQTQAA